MLSVSIMGKLRRSHLLPAKSPASGSKYKGIALPREKTRWVWMGLVGPTVAEVRLFWTKLKGVAHQMRSAAPRRVAPCLSNSNTLFSMCVRTPAAPFGVCPQRPATTQNAVQIPAAPQSAIAIVLY